MLISRLPTDHPFAWRRVFYAAVIVCVTSSRWAIAAPGSASASTADARAAKALAEAAKAGPASLRAFLYAMPKGADLHYHLSGGIYAESFIRAAGEDGLCVDTKTLSFAKPMAETRSIPPQPVCGEGRVRADSLPKDQLLDDQVIDAFSMRTFVPVAADSGHDHFFATFDKFSGTNRDHLGEW